MGSTGAVLFSLVAALALAGTGWSRGEDTEALQRQIEEQGERIDALEGELQAHEEDSAFTEALDSVDIHGYVSQGFMWSNKNDFLAHSSDGSFEFNEFGINFSAELTEQLHAGLQFFSRDLGSLGNNDVGLDWAFVDYRYQDWLGLRAGKIKTPYGLYNETRDIDMLRTCILLPQGVYNEGFRDTLAGVQGLGAYGNVPVGPVGDLDYQALVGTVNIPANSGVGIALNEALGMQVDRVEAETGQIYSLKWDTPLDGLLLGGSFLQVNLRANGTVQGIGAVESKTDPVNMRVFSAEYTWDNLVVAAEWQRMETKSSVMELTHGSTIVTQRTKREAYYLSAAYRFTDLFELGSYYSIYYPDARDKDGSSLVAQSRPAHGAWLKDFALTGRFDLTENWVFKLEGHWMDGSAGLSPSLNPEGTWFLALAKLTASF